MIRKDADHIIVAQGSHGVVAYAVRANGARPAEKFFLGLAEKRSKQDQAKLLTLFRRVADGHKLSGHRFKHLQDKIYEFKSGQIRILCFGEQNNWFLTHGFIKKRDKCRQEDITKAQRIREEHLCGVRNKRRKG